MKKSNIYLEEGDQLAIRNCFIDTKSENSEKIVLEKDYQLSLDFYFYIQDWQIADKKVNLENPSTILNTQSPSNNIFVMCNASFYDAGNNKKTLKKLKSITFQKEDSHFESLDGTDINGKQQLPLTIQYFASGQFHSYSFNIPTLAAPVGQTMPFTFALTDNLFVDSINPQISITSPSQSDYQKSGGR